MRTTGSGRVLRSPTVWLDVAVVKRYVAAGRWAGTAAWLDALAPRLR